MRKTRRGGKGSRRLTLALFVKFDLLQIRARGVEQRVVVVVGLRRLRPFDLGRIRQGSFKLVRDGFPDGCGVLAPAAKNVNVNYGP
jgi:hypothetical protein